jgi:hypothetical protein
LRLLADTADVIFAWTFAGLSVALIASGAVLV